MEEKVLIDNNKGDARKLYLDVCKGIAILLVVFYHIGGFVGGTAVFLNWVAPFFLMIFFFVSGIIIDGGEKYKTPFKDYALKRLKAVMFPYLIWSIIGGIIESFRCGTISSVLPLGYYTLTFRGISTLWFLPAIFFGELILYFVLNSNRSAFISVAALVIGVGATIGLNYLNIYISQTFTDIRYNLIHAPVWTAFHICAAATFLLIGVWGYRLILKNIGERNIAAFVLAIVVFVGCSFLTQMNSGADLNSGSLGSLPPLYYATGIPMCVSLLIITRFLCSFTYKFPVLTWCGKNSLIIMCTHWPCYILLIVYNIAARIVAKPQAESFQSYLYCFVIFFNRHGNRIRHCNNNK